MWTSTAPPTTMLPNLVGDLHFGQCRILYAIDDHAVVFEVEEEPKLSEEGGPKHCIVPVEICQVEVHISPEVTQGDWGRRPEVNSGPAAHAS